MLRRAFLRNLALSTAGLYVAKDLELEPTRRIFPVSIDLRSPVVMGVGSSVDPYYVRISSTKFEFNRIQPLPIRRLTRIEVIRPRAL